MLLGNEDADNPYTRDLKIFGKTRHICQHFSFWRKRITVDEKRREEDGEQGFI
jgi:hypothetical protein